MLLVIKNHAAKMDTVPPLQFWSILSTSFSAAAPSKPSATSLTSHFSTTHLCHRYIIHCHIIPRWIIFTNILSCTKPIFKKLSTVDTFSTLHCQLIPTFKSYHLCLHPPTKCIFGILFNMLCTDVVSIIPNIMPAAISNNLHVSFLIPFPLCPPFSIVHHTIYYPHLHFSSSSTYTWLFYPYSVSTYHLPLSSVLKPLSFIALHFVSNHKRNGGPMENFEQSTQEIEKGPSRKFTLPHLHFPLLIPFPLFPPFSIVHHTIYYPHLHFSSSSTYTWLFYPYSVSTYHLPLSSVLKPLSFIALHFVSNHKRNGGPMENFEQSTQEIEKGPSRKFTLPHLHFPHLCLKVVKFENLALQ